VSENTGFRLPDRVRHRLRRNDEKNAFSTFCETIKTVTLMQVIQGVKSTEHKEDTGDD